MIFPVPSDGQIDVWMVNTQAISEEDLLSCKTVLNDSERSRLIKFRIEEARLQFLIARCLVRTVLSCYAPKRPVDWAFVKNQYGRPRLADGQVKKPLHFNLSHTSGMVVCAVSSSEKIGIDVERVDREMDYVSLAHQVFADGEITKLISCNSMEKREVFFSLWTLKEAYIKARGRGFSLPTKAFWFELGDGRQKISFSPELQDDPQKWHFKQHSPTEKHRIAIAASFASDQVAMQVNFRKVRVSEIVAKLTQPPC
jgi:4'-phosphopantetheinyl transferase